MHRLFVLSAVASVCLVAGAVQTLPVAAAPDLVLLNGKIVTVDRDFSYAEAVAVAGGRFVAVGTTDTVRKLAGPGTRVIDFGGRTVVPGLADGHLHGAGGGPGVDLSRARSLDEVLEAIAARARSAGADDVVVTNSDWHEGQLREQRLPLRRDLDRAAPETPVVVVRGGHEYILNSAALRKWSIDESTPPPPGGRISRYPDGTLNGELLNAGKALVTLPPPPPGTIDDRIAAHEQMFARLHGAGLTSVRLAGISVEQYHLLEEMNRRGRLRMRVSVLLRPERADPAGIPALVDQWRVRPGEGDEWLRVDGIKLGVDGGFEGGFMREPYAEPFGEQGSYRGLQTMRTDEYVGIVKAFNRLGWRVATHAVGDAAIDLVLDAYEAAHAERSIAGRRWVIEHGFIPRDDQFPRMRRLGLVISAQNHLYLAAPSLVKYWGPARAAWTTPVRAYLDHGLVVASGTDAPVVPFPPLWTIYHFVTRDTISAGVLDASQAVSREAALRASTGGNAFLTFEEQIKGSIEPGRLADLVVLSEDILTCPAERIEHTRVLLTLVGGEVVHAEGDFRGTDILHRKAVAVQSD